MPRIFYKAILFLLLTTTAVVAQSQTPEQIYRIVMAGKTDSAFALAKAAIDRGNAKPDMYLIAGRIQAGKGKYDEAITYLEEARVRPKAPAYTKAWALQELSYCYYANRSPGQAKKCLEDCLAINATDNANKAAQGALMTLGLDNFYSSWVTRESAHFVFHFQDTASTNGVDAYVKKHEAAYDSVNSFFNATLFKKIDFYVWSDEQMAKTLLKSQLAFAYSPICIIHTSARHTVGHELTHCLSQPSQGQNGGSRLIIEGLSVYFSLTPNNDLEVLKKSKNSIMVSVAWQKSANYGDDVIYPLGGILVKRLIEQLGKEKFMLLLQDSHYENAKKIYGKDLDVLIAQIEKDING